MAGGDGSQEAGLRKLECSPASGLWGLLPNLPSCVQVAAAVEGDASPPYCDRRIPSTTVSQNQSSFSYDAFIRYLSQWQEKECKSLWNNSTMSHLKCYLFSGWVFCLRVCLVITCMLGALWGHKRASDPLRLELQFWAVKWGRGLQPGSSGRTGRLLTLEPSL